MSKRKQEGISTKQFHAEFKREVRDLGGVAEAAVFYGVSRPFIRNVLLCRELPGKKILELMGLEPVKTINYRYKRIV